MAGPVVEGAAAREAGAEMVGVSVNEEERKADTALQSVAVDGATADAPAATGRVTSDYTADEVRRCGRRLAVEVRTDAPMA